MFAWEWGQGGAEGKELHKGMKTFGFVNYGLY